LIKPIDPDGVGSKSILLTNLAARATRDQQYGDDRSHAQRVPPGAVLYSDNFEFDPSGTNWDVFSAPWLAAPDYNVVFGYDYTSGSVGICRRYPAPHSTRGDTKGLYMTVNKSDAVGSPRPNLYLKNHTFGNNYALRFDMYLVQNSGPSLAQPTNPKTKPLYSA